MHACIAFWCWFTFTVNACALHQTMLTGIASWFLLSKNTRVPYVLHPVENKLFANFTTIDSNILLALLKKPAPPSWQSGRQAAHYLSLFCALTLCHPSRHRNFSMEQAPPYDFVDFVNAGLAKESSLRAKFVGHAKMSRTEFLALIVDNINAKKPVLVYMRKGNHLSIAMIVGYHNADDDVELLLLPQQIVLARNIYFGANLTNFLAHIFELNFAAMNTNLSMPQLVLSDRLLTQLTTHNFILLESNLDR